MLREARSLLQHRDRAAALVRAAHDATPIPIRLGLPLGAVPEFVATIVDRMRTAVPAVTVEIRDPLSTQESVQALLGGALDLALVRLPADVSGLSTLPLRTDRLGVWLAPDDPLWQVRPGEDLPLAALHGRAVFRFDRAFMPEVHDALMAAFNEAGSDPDWVQLPARPAALYMPVLTPHAIALAGEEMPYATGELRYRRVAGLPPLVTALAWPPDAPATVHGCARAVAGPAASRERPPRSQQQASTPGTAARGSRGLG